MRPRWFALGMMAGALAYPIGLLLAHALSDEPVLYPRG